MPSPTRARRAPALVAVCLAAALVPVTTTPASGAPAPEARAGYGRLYVPLRTPIAGVPFKIKGFLTSDVRRPVLLQRQRASGRFETISRTRAGASGKYAFTGVTLPRSSILRARAPRFKGSLNHAKDRITTAEVAVPAVRQSGRIAAVPGIVQQGAVPAAPEDGGYVVAGFRPPRAHRPVLLQRRVKDDWTTVARARQDRAGFAAFPVPPGGTYRAATRSSRHGRAVWTGTAVARSWTPAFDDTFSGDSLDRSVWTDRPAEGAPTQGRRTCARVDGATRSVGAGTLQLGIGLDPERAGQTCSYTTDKYGAGTSPYLVNAQVDSREAFHFTYGIAAARVRWQQPQGMHGGFWLLPSGGKIPGRPDLGTEVDVVEYFGQDSLKGGFGAFVHHLDAAGVNIPLGSDAFATARYKPRGDQWWSSYHVFSVEWTPEQYVFRVDGREFWRERRAVSQAGEYLVLSMLTSDFELPDLSPDELSATASVDWARVWKG